MVKTIEAPTNKQEEKKEAQGGDRNVKTNHHLK